MVACASSYLCMRFTICVSQRQCQVQACSSDRDQSADSSRGCLLSQDALDGNETRKREGLDAIAGLVVKGQLKAFVQETFSLDTVPAALSMVARGGLVSKLGIDTAV